MGDSYWQGLSERIESIDECLYAVFPPFFGINRGRWVYIDGIPGGDIGVIVSLVQIIFAPNILISIFKVPV